MNCQDINELSPLWHSGELGADRRAEFGAHVAACPDCGAELHRQSAADSKLRETLAAEDHQLTDAAHGINSRVRRRIARERMRRWLFPAAAAAAAVVAAILFVTVPRNAPVPPVFADAARDHTTEVVNRSPRHWRTDPAEIAALETAQGISPADVKAVEATGYRLQRVKICRMAGRPWMHLVYSKNNTEVSVYLKIRDAASVPDAASASGPLQLASFARGRVQAIVVTGASRADCERFTEAAEDAL